MEAKALSSARASSLEEIARLCLAAGRMLLECGANARTVHTGLAAMARGLGCTAVEVYCQHSAVIVMLRRGEESLTHMGKVGEHGVNLRRGEAVSDLVEKVAAGQVDCEAACVALKRLPETAGAYPPWLVCVATGLACGAFGRLLGMEWDALLPVLAGAAAGQWTRMVMLSRGLNFFFMVTVVAFVAAFLAGLGGRLAGDGHLAITTVAATLLLVPGMAMLNAQVDALDGRPNLAAARAFRVAYILLFMTLGLALAQRTVGI
jgi:uncharacterized membrane protein YjjP (DUF1212 family)